MRRSGRKGTRLDPERLVRAAVEAYLDGASRERHGEREHDHARRRLSGGSALALGVAIGLGARALYRRARDLDLERVARTIERRLVN
jgi:hypothetical protein